MPDDPLVRVADGSWLAPDEVARKAFPMARRGLSETEVRSFLKRVAQQIERDADREQALISRVRELEERVAELQRDFEARPALSTAEDDALDQLGEETTRVLRSAQEAAQELRVKAQEDADRLRRESEEGSAAAVAELRANAEKEVEGELETAREKGREMVNEARSVRERILADLAKRRNALRADLEELRAAREKLVDAGLRVKRTLAQATEAMTPFDEVATAGVELGEMPELDEDLEFADEPEAEVADASPPESNVPESSEGSNSSGSADVEAPAEAEATDSQSNAETELAVVPEDSDQPEPSGPQAVSEMSAAELIEDPRRPAEVDALFARIRAGREDAVGEPRETLAVVPAAPQAAPAPSPSAPRAAPGPPRGGAADADLIGRRDATLAPLEHDVVRRAKRLLQDEQNELLDAVRRGRKRIDVSQLLPERTAQVNAWASALGPELNEAYRAGRSMFLSPADVAESNAPQRLVIGLVETLVLPMRDKLADSLLSASGGDPDAVMARIGARYREWRSQHLEPGIGDVLAAAYTRGVFDAAPEKTWLRWVPAEVGRCTDCDDNALEPTPKGASFPTGQQLPPAHPGCRCLLAISTTGRSSRA
jgi:DivIVA domain-containing protein